MQNYNLVLHVDRKNGTMNIAFRNAINFAKALAGKQFHVVLVVNAAAVTELVAENEAIAKNLEAAVERGLEILVCNNALNENGIAPEYLFPQCRIVPAGIVELVNLQNNGYAYVKP